MTSIMDPTLRGTGRITGAFFNPAGDIAAVVSEFALLVNPPARAAYGGTGLRYRLGLYRRGEPVPFAIFDELCLPINDVGFHPTLPRIVIGAGRYDGGYLFEGELAVWNWQTGQSRRPFADIPEVVRCRYDASGERIDAWVRPWNEEWDGLDDSDWSVILDTLFLVQADDSEAAWAGQAPAVLELDSAATVAASGLAADDHRLPATRLAHWLGVPELACRGAIRDIAWLGPDRIGVTHDGCLLDIYGTDGSRLAHHTGPGYGAEILRGAGVHVHGVLVQDGPEAYRRDSRLYALTDNGLVLVQKYDDEYTFSAASDGRLLGRRNRLRSPGSKAVDLLMDPARDNVQPVDVGHYDCFNHYIGISGAPHLFALQGTPASSHEHKYLCIVQPDGAVQRLWPLLKQDGTRASHAMECRGAYVADALGAGVVIAGQHYNPSVGDAYQGFIYRRHLERGQELWRHPTPASPSAIIHLPEADLVAAAFLDGTLMLIDVRSGQLRLNAKARIDGLPTLIHAMDARDGQLALGTVDGRIAVRPVEALLGAGNDQPWVEIG
ncbi:hypothetical protein PUP66_18040 [Pseudomonas chlororaphis]|uniref:hypothetical protein n=1 Tax=Pseudomonas chlororaphis TaxID=587753 RepID=UPI000E0C3F47|nr:hypothetical protein [Pseudomonas chlororaphis]AZD16370.1 hypothetical protein C4K25_3443 [Pseudomonas chlororaphis]WDH45023.1 hypothetical protein PUP66_18040 [Pseudomonas chlororaphis]WDH56869.1 hypothetical protein PUP56_18045 [Pseudomonas chlororaphis]WQE16128.1 hypothetical protein U0007_16855 [Pseudomonas chlororaphis]